MNRVILIMAVIACMLYGACASKQEAQPNAAAGEEGTAGDEATHHRYRDLKSDPNWDSAESANEQLEGD